MSPSNTTQSIFSKKSTTPITFIHAVDNALETNDDFLEIIANGFVDSEALDNFLLKLAKPLGSPYTGFTGTRLREDFFRHLGRLCSEEQRQTTNPAIVAAYGCFKISRCSEHRKSQRFIDRNQMNSRYRNNTDKTIYSNIPTLTLAELDESYPPKGMWVCEYESIQDLWHFHLKYGKKADTRLPRHKPMILDKSRLQKIVYPDESVTVRDEETGEIVLIVLRNASSPAVLEHLGGVIRDATAERRNIRKDDAGILTMSGWSAGSRSKSSFHWVRNIVRKHSASQINRLNTQESHAFGFFWNLLQHRLPQEIKDDFTNFMQQSGLPRMNAFTNINNRTLGSYEVKAGDTTYIFNNVELAPPTGAMAQNYARPMHNENQPHKFAVSFTVERQGGVDQGGHFYIASYGIKVKLSANTIIVWQPKHVHGTSLPNAHPAAKSPKFLQRGLAFVTSNRLPNAWRKYLAQVREHPYTIDGEAKKVEEVLWGPEAIRDEIFD